MIEGMSWHDNKGKLTLIDVPGLNDSGGKDQYILDNMAEKLIKIPAIDIFIIIMTGDRLGN